ncbi:MAG: polysaccharide biosynthesis protein [Verrucomicrobia bacterium]|nr:polysaccharide biosynthesis protein [Verrucomicrobiota bacterium]
MAIQVLGFLSGVIIVRHLSKPDYAWFTIVNSFVATMGMLADVGIGGALSAIGGAVWQDNARFGSLIRTALTLRRMLAVVSITVVTPIFIWVLVKNQASPATIAVLVPAALAGFVMQLTAGVLGVVLSLRQEIRRMQLLGLAAALLRLGLLAPACLIFIDARVAILTGVIAVAVQVWILRRWVRASVDWHAPQSPDYRSRILGIVKKQAPITIFHCVQGQIIVLLISIFGSEERVAEIGALGRFAVIFTLISSVMNGIVVPRFARCQDRSILRRRYWQVAIGFAFLTGSLVALSAAFPRPLLWVLGGRYANLEGEVWLMMLNAALGGMFVCLVSMTYCKGWILPAAICIPLEMITQIVLILIFDMSTVRGVLLVGCIGSAPGILLTIIVAYLNTRRLTEPSGIG